jgi:hypothetical protein
VTLEELGDLGACAGLEVGAQVEEATSAFPHTLIFHCEAATIVPVPHPRILDDLLRAWRTVTRPSSPWRGILVLPEIYKQVHN